MRWNEVTYASCSSAIPAFSTAKVIKVYDGDSLTLGTKDLVRYSCRLMGIDTAELRSRNATEKERAIASRNFLRDLVLNKVVDVEIKGKDKYGRLLVYVRVDGKDVSTIMLSRGGAVEYQGGKKPCTNWARVDIAGAIATPNGKSSFTGLSCARPCAII